MRKVFTFLRRAFCLVSLVCITYNANATTVENAYPEFAASGDSISSISSLFRLDSSKFGKILESIQDFLNNLADNYPDGVDPVGLDINLKFDFNLMESNSLLLVQVIYNTLAGEDGMINQMKDKEIKKFDEKTLKKIKKQFTKRSNKEIKKLCKGDRQTQKDLKHRIKKLLDGIQIKEKE